MEENQRSPSLLAPWIRWLSGAPAQAEIDPDAYMRLRIEQLMDTHVDHPDDGFAETVCMVRRGGDVDGETVLFDPGHAFDLDASLEQYMVPDEIASGTGAPRPNAWTSRWDVVLVVSSLYCAMLLAGSLTVLAVAWFSMN